MDWKERAAQLKFDEDISWTKLPDIINKEFGISLTKDQIRDRLRVHPRYQGVKTGQEERKPAYTDMGDYYIVTSGKREIEISKEKLKQLKSLYCGSEPLTINQICRKIDIPRRDFVLVKTAFSITHDDVPFIDEELSEDNIENLVQKTLEKQKEKYFVKLQQEEINSLKKEVAEYRRKDYFLSRLHGLIEEHMQEFIRSYQGPTVLLRKPKETGKMLEVPIVDLHLGKLAWAPETDENYDHKIAEKRFMSVIYDIVDRTKDMKFEKIVFPIGNDFFNFDTIEGTTTAGTRQDNDVRWAKLFDKGVEILIRAIDIFAQFAPVDVFLVPGNHDRMTSFYAIKYLEAWFRNDQNVAVNSNPKTRKYVEFGKCLIGYTHMDKERKRIEGNMQVEAAAAWGRTKYREWHGGHLHSEQVREVNGIKIRNLSSVTGTDVWHCDEGYVGAIAESQSFIWDKEKGLQEIMYSVVEREV